jgi:DNA-binding HxlR family transcriptional regulator
VDFERLRQIDKLFEHRWEAFVIGSLAESDRPMRFNQLAYAVSEHTRTRMVDSSLARIKDRLIHKGLVEETKTDDGYHAYALTEEGREKAEILASITDALDECRNTAGDPTATSQIG